MLVTTTSVPGCILILQGLERLISWARISFTITNSRFMVKGRKVMETFCFSVDGLIMPSTTEKVYPHCLLPCILWPLQLCVLWRPLTCSREKDPTSSYLWTAVQVPWGNHGAQVDQIPKAHTGTIPAWRLERSLWANRETLYLYHILFYTIP